MKIANMKNIVRGTAYDPRLNPQVIYVGRAMPGIQGSPLGNPYRVGINSRGSTIRAYKSWLYHKIQDRDPAVMQALSEITEDSTLVCWCTPLPCHAEVIRDAWRWARKEGIV